jgi:hypothetical protein
MTVAQDANPRTDVPKCLPSQAGKDTLCSGGSFYIRVRHDSDVEEEQ